MCSQRLVWDKSHDLPEDFPGFSSVLAAISSAGELERKVIEALMLSDSETLCVQFIK